MSMVKVALWILDMLESVMFNSSAPHVRQSRPVPAGAINAAPFEPFYCPPITLPPVPIGYNSNGQPFFPATPLLRPAPRGVTREGIKYFHPSEPTSLNHSDLMRFAGFSAHGDPLFYPSHLLVPQPSGIKTYLV